MGVGLPRVYAIDHAHVAHIAVDTYPDRARTVCSGDVDYAELPLMAAFATSLTVAELRGRCRVCFCLDR